MSFKCYIKNFINIVECKLCENKHLQEDVPVRGWRKILQNISGKLGRASMFFCGFINVTYHGEMCSNEEAPILVVAPHSSFFDAIAVFCLLFGSSLFTKIDCLN